MPSELTLPFVPLPPSVPALRYFGGKWRLAPWVIGNLPSHRVYVEPFGGAASVLLRKPPSHIEVMNDRNSLVVTFFRVVRERGDELMRALEYTPVAVDEYDACREIAGDDVERARRFFVRSWGGFGGCSGHTYDGRLRATGWRRSSERNIAAHFVRAVESLRCVRERLRNVVIENLDWRDIIDTYDGDDTCFYVDPPYVHESRGRTAPSDGYGDLEMSDAEHRALCRRLSSVRGDVVLSGYPNAIYDSELTSPWERVKVSAKGQAAGSRTEVLWIRDKNVC